MAINKKMKGVPPGYTHNWRYEVLWTEEKLPDGGWIVTYTGTKTRPPTEYYKVGKDTTIRWWIEGTQNVKKISPNKYIVSFTGVKKCLKHRIISPNQRKLTTT